jgi:hypothetical protein
VARTKLLDDEVAFQLLELVVSRARRDLRRPAVNVEDRASALEFFGGLLETDGISQRISGRPGQSQADSADVRIERGALY